MATPKIWSNVQVAMQSALAAADTVTAIAKEPDAEVSATAHGVSNGEYIIMTAQGMHQVDGRVFRAANVATDALDLEDEDTTLYETFSSGSFQVITFGISFGTMISLTSSGGDFSFIDITTIHDNIAKQIPGIAAAAAYSIDNIHDVSDTALAAMKVASDLKSPRAFKFTFPDGQIMVFCGYVGTTLLPTGNAQDLVTTPSVITMKGTPTYYSA